MRCIHTELVAIALWVAEGRGAQGLDISETAGGEDGDVDETEGFAKRTAQRLLNADAAAYSRNFKNCLNHLAVLVFHPRCPAGLVAVVAPRGEVYTTSQTNCSSCGGAFSHVDEVKAKLVTQVGAPIL